MLYLFINFIYSIWSSKTKILQKILLLVIQCLGTDMVRLLDIDMFEITYNVFFLKTEVNLSQA